MKSAPTISTPCLPATVVMFLSTSSRGFPQFKQTAGRYPLFTIEEIHVRADVITPCLREILEFRHPHSRLTESRGSS